MAEHVNISPDHQEREPAAEKTRTRQTGLLNTSPGGIAQQKLQESVNSSPHMTQMKVYQDLADRHTESTSSDSGLPSQLKSGIESLSGMSMDDVHVHYNSSKPAQLQAHAYAQGNEIHLGSGQERHLPHEAWHVVQQRQGRVQATMQMKAGVPVNDDPSLEKEADVMGAKALQAKAANRGLSRSGVLEGKPVVQGIFYDNTGARLITYAGYLANKIPWNDGTRRGEDRETTGGDPTLGTLLGGPRAALVRGFLSAGLNVGAINSVETRADSEAANALMHLNVSGAGTANLLENVYSSPTKIAELDQYAEFKLPSAVPFKLIPRVKDLIPEVGDLKAAFEPAKVCTLIAIAKAETPAAVVAKLNLHPTSNSVRHVTEAMHTHYFGQGIHYDDTSTHVSLMASYGYHIKYSGPCDWHSLHLAFPGMEIGKDYIFDIEGHTVKVRKRAEVPRGVMPTDLTLPNYYTPDSEAWNFNVSHWNRDVWYVFEK